MKKLNLLLGTVNSLPEGTAPDILERHYEECYKPFLQLANEYPGVKLTLYYCGSLFQWLDENRPEALMLLDDLVHRKQIEILSGGFYAPVFSLIPRRYRVEQIEYLNTFVSKRFGRRPRGAWIYPMVWEDSMPLTLKNSGIEYTFLNEKYFRNIGIDGKGLFRPYLSEEQGKLIKVFPVSRVTEEKLFETDPRVLVEQLAENASEKESRVLSLFWNGEREPLNDGRRAWMDSFFAALQESSSVVTRLPNRYSRETAALERVYFGNISFELSGEPERTAFRNVLNRYRESNKLYSKMMYVDQLINQVRGDKARKKSARLELLKGQCHAVYWHGNEAGVYDPRLRKHAYTAMIEAEKMTREKGVFKSSIIKADMDLDGMDEYLIQTAGINLYIHRRSGSIFEIDYLPKSWNYGDSMAIYREWYHQDDEVKEDGYLRNAFIDRFVAQYIEPEALTLLAEKDCSDFSKTLYQEKRMDKERKLVCFNQNGHIWKNSKKYSMNLEKEITLKRNTVSVRYGITNNSDMILDVWFVPEINLSPGYAGWSSAACVPKENGETLTEWEHHDPEGEITTYIADDGDNNTTLTLSSDIPFRFSAAPHQTRVRRGGTKENIYQGDVLAPQWKIRLQPGETYDNEIGLKIEKKQRR